MCLVCDRIEQIKEGRNKYFVRELETGYVVLGDYQRFKGYTVFVCKSHTTELHFLEAEFRKQFLYEMSLVAEAVYDAFEPDKLNYELLGQGEGVHMHWHILPRKIGDTPKPGPIWQLTKEELYAAQYVLSDAALSEMKQRLNTALDKLL